MYRHDSSNRASAAFLAVVLAAVLLLGPAPAAIAAPADAGPAWGWLTDFYGSLAGLFTHGETAVDEGPDLYVTGSTTTDSGGVTTTDDGGDAGAGMDPNGLNATEDDGEAGAGMDPNG